MKISLTSISVILIVVICLLTANTAPANGSLVKNVKNDSSSKNLMALLISNGGSVSNNSTNTNTNFTTRSLTVSHQQQRLQQNNQSVLSIVGSMRENDNNLTATVHPPLNANSTYFTFTKNRSEVSTPENNSHTNEFGKGVKIALINPSFTSAAYNNSYYNFYGKYANTPSKVNVTSDSNLLSSRISGNQKELSSASGMVYLLKNIKWLNSQSNITLLTVLH